MPTPILRAGPFASSSDSFLDEPDPIEVTTVPVNCATNDWANDTWKAYAEVSTASGGVSDPNNEDREDYDGTLPDLLSYDISSVGSQGGRIQFAFRYQAAVDFDINIDAEANADSGSSLYASFSRIEVYVNGTLVVDEEDIGLGVTGVSYDNDITIPASVTPALVAIIVRSGTNPSGPVTSSADASLEISVPV